VNLINSAANENRGPIAERDHAAVNNFIRARIKFIAQPPPPPPPPGRGKKEIGGRQSPGRGGEGKAISPPIPTGEEERAYLCCCILTKEKYACRVRAFIRLAKRAYEDKMNYGRRIRGGYFCTQSRAEICEEPRYI